MFSPIHSERLVLAASNVREMAPDDWLQKANSSPPIAVVLGSGWSKVAEGVEVHLEVPYGRITALGETTVPGHEGKLLYGYVGDQRVLMWVGRRHLYEGEGFTPIAVPLLASKFVGAEVVLLTNAAGGMQEGMEVGDLMAITDHYGAQFPNILIGPELSLPDDEGCRFTPMNDCYARSLLPNLIGSGTAAGKRLKQGVYAALTGPTYEALTEVRDLRNRGVDAVGMSTVPETIFARRIGMRVAAMSCISNLAAGLAEDAPTHIEVQETLEREMPNIRKVVHGFVERVYA